MKNQLLASSSKPIVLIGLMGAGKTRIGRLLAGHLALPFSDADEEIAKAAGMSVEDIFTTYGETAFRECEQKVIARLLGADRRVIATGGGAVMNPATRERLQSQALSVWLRADLDILVERTSRRGGRPLLKGRDIRATLADLMAARYPIYGEADVVVDTSSDPPERTVQHVLSALTSFLDARAGPEDSAL